MVIVLGSVTQAYTGTSDNYKVDISELGVHVADNSSTNYKVVGTVQDKYVGQNKSDNYKGCVGFHCFIRLIEVVEEEVVPGFQDFQISEVVYDPFDLFSIVKARTKGFIFLLSVLVTIIIIIILKRKRDKKLLHEKKYYADREL